jgi:glycine betaine catabolism A
MLTQTDDFDPAEWGLVAIRADVWLGWLFVDLSGTAPSLSETYGNLADLLSPYEPDRLVTAARHSYQVAANWKLAIENYHECYHCTSIHPALCEVSPTDSGADYQPTGLWCGGSMDLKDHAVTMSLTGESGGVMFRGLPEDRSRSVLYVGLWPNLLVSAHPDYVMTHRLVPIAPDRTFVECDWLWSPESIALDSFDPAYATDFWDITNREDWGACERVQSATANRGFLPGPLSPMESTIYQFLTMLGHAYRGEAVTPPVVPARGFYQPTESSAV